MRRRNLLIFVVLLLALALIPAQAQVIQPDPNTITNPDANISWPPPVFLLRGEFEIYGSANLPNMSNYFLEFRPLALDGDDNNNDVQMPWFPVTLPSSQQVSDGLLGTWNTRNTPDGLYELRLTVNVTGAQAESIVVSPLRVMNELPDFISDIDLGDTEQPSDVPTQVSPPTRPTLAPSPTTPSNEPTVTANVDANVRSGDSVNYPRIDSLRAGQTAQVIGISSAGSGWYYIQLEDGTRGWVAPSIVTLSGVTGSLPRINPPATPTPIPTSTPTVRADLTGSSPSLNPNPPVCNEEFEVLVNITNIGETRSNSPATVLFEDVYLGDGSVQVSFTQAVPELDPGENFVVGGPMTVSTFYGEQHRIRVTIDTGNNVTETDDTNNVLVTDYVLQKGSCP
ncbi:MAG: SH3 domain-containing protein [Phototrophicaceae bacterium]